MSKSSVGSPGASGVTVRTMTGADSQFVGALVFQAFKEKIFNVLGTKGVGFCRDLLGSPGCLAHAHHRIFVAENDGKKVGTMMLKYPGDGGTLEIRPTPEMPYFLRLKIRILILIGGEKVPEGKCLLEILAVTDGNRGKGIGQTMLNVADCEAMKHNCKSIYLLVADGNRAKHLYERHGYVAVARQDSWLTVRIMGAKFTVMEKPLSS